MAHSGIVTLLFADFVKSTELPQPATAADHSFHGHHKLMTDTVAAAGGQEMEWLGNGMAAAFSSSADAVRCAINLQQASRRPVAGTRVEIRIGVHAGEASRGEGGYLGGPMVTARRFCNRAKPGQILCSRLIADLLAARQAFSFHDLGSLELDGAAAPMGACEVVYVRNDPAALLNRTPFVGRADHLKLLSARLAQAANGIGSVSMLLGEQGWMYLQSPLYSVPILPFSRRSKPSILLWHLNCMLRFCRPWPMSLVFY